MFTAGETQTIYVQAYDDNQNINYSYIFNDSEAPLFKSEIRKYGGIGNSFISNTSNGSYTLVKNDFNPSIVALLKKVCNLTFQNPGHLIILNGNNYYSSASTAVVDHNTISPSAEGYFIEDNIEYLFLGKWRNSSGQLTASTIITATQHDTYTAEYLVQPLVPSISFGTTLYQPIQINWTDNPNPAVTQYRVHRMIYSNGSWGPDQVIGTVTAGTQTFTDYDYCLGTWRQGTWLQYGLTAYYNVTGAWTTGGANTQVYGSDYARNDNSQALLQTEKEIPAEYSITNYPNPFNPTTTINYQLPVDGMVTIKVYDMLGKEAATLVNENKSAGYYKVDFNGSNFSSGVYICTIQTGNFSKSIKMLLTK